MEHIIAWTSVLMLTIHVNPKNPRQTNKKDFITNSSWYLEDLY